MRRITAVTVALMMCVTMMTAGCGKSDSKAEEATEATEATEVATEFAITTDAVEEAPTETVEAEIEEYDFSVTEETPVETETVSEDLAPVADEFGITAIDEIKLYAKEGVRMRTEPNTDSEIAGQLKAGDEVTANGRNEEWHRIKKSNGDVVYVKSEYLTETKTEKKEEDNAQATDNENKTTNNDTAANTTDTATTTTDPAAAAAAALAAAAATTTNNDTASNTNDAASTTNDNASNTADSATNTDAAAATPATPAVSAGATYDVNGLKVNAAEYNDLLNTWRWATANGTDSEALEIVLHHPAGDLEAVLKSHGLR